MNKTPRSFEHEQKVADFLDAFSPLTENIVRSFIADYPELESHEEELRNVAKWSIEKALRKYVPIEESNFQYFASLIAYRDLYNAARKILFHAGKNTTFSDQGIKDVAEDTDVWPLPGTIVEERAIITALLEALEQMPEDRKKILKQYFGIGDAEGNRKTLEEIASELSCTKETVRNQLGTALRELRILLNQFDDKPLTKITRREREVVKKKIITRDQVLEAHATCGGRLDEASKLLIASKGWIRKIWKEANLTVARPDKTISSETFDAIDRLIFQHAPDKAIVAQLRIPRTVIGQQRVKIGKLNFEEWKARRAELNIK